MQMHGLGTYKYKKTDDIYSGQYCEGQKEGNGIYEFGNDQSRLDGLWEKGQFKSGERHFKDAGSYHGTFDGGQPTGPGHYSLMTAGGIKITQEGEYQSSPPVAEDAESAEPPGRAWKGKPIYSS